MKSKTYVLSEYKYSETRPATTAMYEIDDNRLTGKETIAGTFKRDKAAKGLVNGGEIGFFTTTTGSTYVIFSDHSAKFWKQ